MQLTWFDHFPEPVFYIQNGRIQYSNEAATALEPTWTSGTEMPENLSMEPDEEGIFSCVLAGKVFQAGVTRTEDGLLLVLRPPVEVSAVSALTALPVQLRELINNIQMVTRLLTPLVEENGEADAKLHLAVLNQSFYRLLRLARHLELADRVKAENSTVLQEQALDLAELCREVTYGASKLAEHAGVTLRMSVPGGMVPTMGDKQLLEVMLLELLSNAIKAAGKDGEAGIRLSSNASNVLIAVWDNGPGMNQTELTALMDGTSPDSLPKPGTGLRLGLPIARCIAAAHGGALLVESQEGKGLKVTASLPLRKPAKGGLHTPYVCAEEGFSPLLTLLSDSLPWQAFEE